MKQPTESLNALKTMKTENLEGKNGLLSEMLRLDFQTVHQSSVSGAKERNDSYPLLCYSPTTLQQTLSQT